MVYAPGSGFIESLKVLLNVGFMQIAPNIVFLLLERKLVNCFRTLGL